MKTTNVAIPLAILARWFQGMLVVLAVAASCGSDVWITTRLWGHGRAAPMSKAPYTTGAGLPRPSPVRSPRRVDACETLRLWSLAIGSDMAAKGFGSEW